MLRAGGASRFVVARFAHRRFTRFNLSRFNFSHVVVMRDALQHLRRHLPYLRSLRQHSPYLRSLQQHSPYLRLLRRRLPCLRSPCSRPPRARALYPRLFCLLLLCVCAPLAAQEHIRHIKSNHSVETTIERAERIAAYHGLRVLGIVDYAELAAKWLAPKKQALPPSRLLVFIDDRGGVARALQGNRLLAIEMPLKILVWKDDNGGVWVSYRDLGASDYQPAIPPSLLAKLDELTRAFAEEAAR